MVFDRILQLVLLPILAVQTVWVIAQALRLPEASGSRCGTRGQGPELRMLIVGDSSAAGVGVDHQEEALAGQLAQALGGTYTVSWRLEARTGVTSAQALARLHDAAPDRFDIAVIALGVNDATRLLPAGRWVQTGQDMRRHLRKTFSVQRIYVSGLPPLGDFPLLPRPLASVLGRHAARLTAAQARAIAAERDTVLLSFDMPFDPNMVARDGFHPGPQAYRLWAQQIAARILQDLRSQ